MKPVTGSLRLRMGVVIGLLWLLIAIVSAMAFHGFQTLASDASELVDREARLAILATRTNQHAQTAALHLLRLLLTNEREVRVQLYASMDEALNTADQALKQLENDQQHPLVGEVQAVRVLRDRYGEAFQATVEQIELDGPSSARHHFETVTEPALKQLLAATDMLAVHLQDLMQARAEALNARSLASRRVIVFMGLLALVVGLLVAVWVARRILMPVNAAARFADDMAAGNYLGPAPAAGRDEVGSMLRALDLMRDRVAEREARIRRIAYVDELTGLANRNGFFESVRRMESAAGSLLLVDVDRFASINKALGHAVGDALLKGMAMRLQQALPADALLARLWGDEFGLWIPQTDPRDVEQASTRLREALRAPLDIDGQRIDLEASMGVAIVPAGATALSDALRQADQALRRAKRRRLGIVMAQDLPSEPEPAQLSLMGELREALAQEQFQVHYQPKVDAASGRVMGAEALIRWQHPTRGLVPPARFIPFAEQTGFIRDITPWLIRRVVGDAAAWRERGWDLVLSANLSVHDLAAGDTLIQGLIEALDRAAVPPAALCLEITESALMDEPDVAIAHLRRLADLGVRLAIDDYGSGMASLAYVKDLPVHELKIDRAFVADVHQTPKHAAIIKSTLLLCHELGLSVVAEGAENPEDIAWLADHGCQQIQGFGVARPMPFDVCSEWLEKRMTP